MEKNSPVLGLTIQLHKYGLNTSDRGKTQKLIFGFYDSLVIKPVRQWLQYSPRNGYDAACSVSTLEVSHYPIKVLFPGQEEISRLPDFCYKEWTDPDFMLQQYPCVSIFLITLTDEFVNNALKQKQEPSIRFAETVQEHCKAQKMNLQGAHCCILPSIGYSDCCILAADNSWKFAMDLSEQLHSLQYDDKPVLSTDYMMPVYCRNSQGGQARFDDLTLSVRVNLNVGCTAQALADYVPEECSVYRVSGGADCLITARDASAAQKLLDFLLGRSGGNNFVIDMASTLQVEINPSPKAGEREKAPLLEHPEDESSTEDGKTKKDPPSKYYEIESAVTLLNEKVRCYKELLLENKRHARQASALLELAASIQNICTQQHTGELRQVMLALTTSFTYCLDRCIDLLKDKSADWDIPRVERAVDLFRDQVGSFLADLSRSDCFFMEQEQYNHSSVSSSTRLLLAYNRWLNDFAKSIHQTFFKDNESEYTFLVTSGGCDWTQTYNPFHFLDPCVQNGEMLEKLPLIIRMSEMSLFDFSGTIIRVTHECMHFCGERWREEREAYIVGFIAKYYAQVIADGLFQYNRYHSYYTGILRHYYSNLESCQLDSLEKELECCFYENWADFSRRIENMLRQELQPNRESGAPISTYLSKNEMQMLTDRLTELFSENDSLSIRQDRNLSLNPFAGFLCRETQVTIERYLDCCDQIMRNHNMTAMFFAFDRRKQQLLMRQRPGNADWADYTTSEWARIVLSQLLMSAEAALPERDSLAKMLNVLRKQNILSVLDDVFDVFSESFSDVIACTTLGANFSDYFLMHVFENWDLERALQGSRSNTYRILAVLQVCFPDYLEVSGNNFVLAAKAEKEFSNAIDWLEKHGMPGKRLDAGELCARINFLLGRYSQVAGYLSELTKYLIMCKERYESRGQVNIKRYRKMFGEIRLLSIDPDCTEQLQGSILKMVRAFTEQKL